MCVIACQKEHTKCSIKIIIQLFALNIFNICNIFNTLT